MIALEARVEKLIKKEAEVWVSCFVHTADQHTSIQKCVHSEAL